VKYSYNLIIFITGIRIRGIKGINYTYSNDIYYTHIYDTIAEISVAWYDLMGMVYLYREKKQ